MLLKIAVTIWGNRVSPVFDAAKTLLIADMENQMILNKNYISFDPGSPEELIKLLKKIRVSILVCGAISTGPADLFVENDIKLISFVTGNALEFIETFARRQIIEKSYMMPGCSKQYSWHHKFKNFSS
jgi:predicted Fe-Mo cluster-binding NifX family protein